MNLRRVLLFTVLADAILSIGSDFIDFTGAAATDRYAMDINYGLWYPIDGALILCFFGLLVLAWVGILRFWNPARFLYLAAWAISLLSHAVTDSYRASGWYYALYNLLAVIGGFLIALIFCSELRHRYNALPRDALPPVAV